MTLHQFAAKIIPGCLLRIEGLELKAIGKSTYVTQSQPDTAYVKAFFEGHHALVICPEDQLAYFGRDVGSIGICEPMPESLVYQGELYSLVEHDYQIVKELVFGSPLDVEGEVEFWDYECLSDKNRVLSLGVAVRTGKHSDIVATVLSSLDGVLVECKNDPKE
ncbi:hypothetical protein ACFLS5_02780 [Candidatus Bipolaricaulota bacterium]